MSTLSRRGFLKLAAISAGAAIMAGCSGKSTDGATNPPAGEKRKMEAWGWEGAIEGIEFAAQKLMEKTAGLTIEIKKFPYDDFNTNFLNAIVAGTGAPDVAPLDANRITVYMDGLADLAEVAKPYYDQFLPPTVSLATYQGKFYGFATDSEPAGLFYRKDLWDQYGITEESITTWDDLIAVGEKLNSDTNGAVKMYHVNSNDPSHYEVMALQLGMINYFFNEDDTKIIVDGEKTVQAISKIKQLYDSDACQRDPEGGYSGEEMAALLMSDKVTSIIYGPAWYPLFLTGDLPDLSGKFHLMRLPGFTKDTPRVGYQQPAVITVTKTSKYPDLAWELAITGCTGDAARNLYEKTKVAPPWKTLHEELMKQPDEYFGGQKIYEVWDTIVKDIPEGFYFGKGFIEAESIMATYMGQIITGQVGVENGLKTCADEMRSKLKKG